MNGQIKLISKMVIKTYENFNQVFDFFKRDSYVQVAHIQQNSLKPRLAEPCLLNVFFFFLSTLLQRNQSTANISKPL